MPLERSPAINGSRILVLVLFAAVVAIPIGFYGCDDELARWKAVQAQVQYDAGDTEAAIEMMRHAAALAPGDLRLRLWLADWLMQQGRADQALEQLDEILEKTTAQEIVLQAKADCLVHLGRPNEALEALKSISQYLSQQEQNSPQRLNAVAYYRALAGVELDRAQEDIQTAINDSIKNLWPIDLLVPYEDQVFVAAALISRQVNRQAEVLPLLSDRIELTYDLLNNRQRKSSESIYTKMQNHFPLESNDEKDIKNDLRELQVHHRTLCVLLTARAILYQDVDQKQLCNQDRIQVVKLGFEPEAILEKLPSNGLCLQLLSTGSAYFDTRGMVSLGNHLAGAAEKDFDLAILSASLLNRSYTSKLFNSATEDFRGYFDQKRSRQNEAVLLYHRSLLFDKTGEAQRAESDRQRIRNMGFQPGPGLF